MEPTVYAPYLTMAALNRTSADLSTDGTRDPAAIDDCLHRVSLPEPRPQS